MKLIFKTLPRNGQSSWLGMCTHHGSLGRFPWSCGPDSFNFCSLSFNFDRAMSAVSYDANEDYDADLDDLNDGQ